MSVNFNRIFFYNEFSNIQIKGAKFDTYYRNDNRFRNISKKYLCFKYVKTTLSLD